MTRKISALAVISLAFFVFVAPLKAANDSPDNPTPLEALKQSNDRVDRFTLDNGMICLVKEDHSAPVVAIQIWVGTGSIDEDEFLGAGLSHFVEHMIFKGTPKRPKGRIMKDIDDAGGTINAYTTLDRTVFHTQLPSKNWKIGLDVLADAVMNASFPADEWGRERQVILREMDMGKDEPDSELGKLLSATAYRVHPYRFPVIGYEDIFKRTTRNDLADFFRRNYVPDGMIVSIVGDVSGPEIKAELEKTFSSFTRRARRPPSVPAEPPQISPRFSRQTGKYEVTRLEWAYHTVSVNHPDSVALDILASVVGAGRSSRLVQDIKEKQKLVYSINAWSWTGQDPGLFGISAICDPAKESAVIKAIQEEIDQWVRAPFSSEEIEKAKRMTLVGVLSPLQTMDGQAADFASSEFYTANYRYSETVLDLINHVTPRSLQKVARKYLTENTRTLAILSPASASPTTSSSTSAIPKSETCKLVLSNGIPLIVREDHRLPFVFICAALRGGLLDENAGDNGITQLMSDLLTRGTPSRSSKEIAQITDERGGYISPFCGKNSFGLQVMCLKQDVDTFAELMADCLLHPLFSTEEIEKQRVVQLATIRQQREDPFFVAEEALRQMMFPEHPYRWTPQGTTEAVKRLGRQDLVTYHEKHLVSGNIALSIFGDVTADQARQLAESYFAGIAGGKGPAVETVGQGPKLPARMKKREPREQAIVLAGYPGISVKDPRMDALNFIQDALSGLSSELGTEVRDKRGLVYYIGGYNSPGVQPGMFVLYAGTRKEHAGEIESFFNKETHRLATTGLRREEWNRAREQIISSYKMSLQNNAGLAQTCALDELYGLGFDHVFSTEKRIQALTPEKVRDAAAALFKPDRQAVSIVLPEPPAGSPRVDDAK